MTGIDFSFSRVPPAVAKAAGHSFAVSYLTDLDTSHRVKAWTSAEIQAYRASGLGVVAVWQGGGEDRTTAWRGGYDRGRRDALRAATQATALGRPDGRPVYFAIDADATSAQLVLISLYFDGIASVFDRRNVGVYGGRAVIEWAQKARAASWFWQTGAWSGGVKVPGIHLYQRVPATRLGGYDIDIDDSFAADYGQWFNAPGGAMAWCPFAQKLALPEADSQVAIRPTQFILHSIAAPWTVQRIFEYWRDSTNLESHFGGGYDGSLAQYIGTTTRADASAQANVRAVSIETASNLEHTDPWTDAQVAMLVRLGVWLCQTHGIPARKPTAWDQPGIGYHRMFPQWSLGGTACPGDARVRQFDSLILPGIQRALAGGPLTSSPTLEPDVELNDAVTHLNPDEPGVTEGGFGGTEIVVRDSLNAANLAQLAVKHRVLPALATLLDPAVALPDSHRLTQADADLADDQNLLAYAPVRADVALSAVRADIKAGAALKAIGEVKAMLSTPTPVTVDAAAVAAALAANPTFLAAIARAVADEDHKRSEA